MLKRMFDTILDLIYPPKCVLCNETIVKKKEYICKSCEDNLKIEVKVQSIGQEGVKCLSIFKYKGSIKNAIWRFKFKGYKQYSEFFAKLMANEILSEFKDMSFDFISFVPLRKERIKNRGYNQAQCLALDISSIINVPCKDVLVKIKSNHVQHELDLVHRRENVKGVYDVIESLDIKNKTILLCDDIVTSGSTLDECVKVLLENGAKEVVCSTIAYIPPRLDFLNKSR